MKNIIKIILILLLCKAGAFAQPITVKQDGSGDFENIQAAVDAAAGGDTVLVWPGTYQENVHFTEKDLTLGSLSLTTGDISYAWQTIIDGNHSGSCIWIEEVDFAEINGFTLMNGSGSYYAQSGGGFIAFSSYAIVKNCIVMENSTFGLGAGIYFSHSNGVLSGCIIKNNHSYSFGGGVGILNGELILDSLNPCSIYSNYARQGTDFSKAGDDCPPVHLYLDTATVMQPDHYYFYSDRGGFHQNDITYNISTAVIQQQSQNLYVSNEGDNSASGLSAGEPLKNLSYALLKIASDSLQPDTIFLANGIYSPSGGEKLPFNLKSYVSIVGESRDSTILDAEFEYNLLYGSPQTDSYLLKNLTLQHGHGNKPLASYFGAFFMRYNRNAAFENLLFKDNIGSQNSSGYIAKSNGFVLRGVNFVNNLGGASLAIGTSYEPAYDPPFRADTVRLYNCRFHDNKEDTTSGSDYGSGQSMYVSSPSNYPDSMTCYIVNSEFLRTITTPENYGGITSNTLTQFYGSKVLVVNSTFGDNYLHDNPGGAVGVTNMANMFIYNSVLYNNHPAQLWLYSDNGVPGLSVYNSLVEDGLLGIKIFSPNVNLNYDEATNIDADPLWSGLEPYPYSLSYGSPCINTGTLDLPPEIELPDTDLAGNPRVWDGQIDMGAYEYGPWVGVDYRPPAPPAPQISAAPNPFFHETTINYRVKEKGKQQIRVYDIHGNHISTLLDVTGLPGSGNIRWSTGDNGHQLPAGVYIIELLVNGENKGSVKVVKK